MEFLIAMLLFLFLVAFVIFIFYNRIIKLKIRVEEGWSDILVQLKRRHDLIGNLVNTVKGYASHEQETFQKVVEARSAAKAAEGKSMDAVQSAEQAFEVALKGLNINALAEAYPDLKANQNFSELQAELSDTENKIAASRRFYNTTVVAYNTTIKQIPGNLVAPLAKALPAEFFELEEDQQAEVEGPPAVSFDKAKAVMPSEKEKEIAAKMKTVEVKGEEPAKEEVKTEAKPAEAPAAAPAPAPTPTPETPKAEEKPAEAPAPAPEAPKTEEKPVEAPAPEPATAPAPTPETPAAEEKPADDGGGEEKKDA